MLFLFLPAWLILFAFIKSRAGQPKQNQLPVRRLPGLETWPVLPLAPQHGILAHRSGTTSAPAHPAVSAKPALDPAIAVQFRLLGRSAWAVANHEVLVLLDEQLIGAGFLRNGFDARVDTTAGRHELQLCSAGITYPFAVDFPAPGAYEAEVQFSALNGQFLVCRSDE
jgi:hypothetical protein